MTQPDSHDAVESAESAESYTWHGQVMVIWESTHLTIMSGIKSFT